MIVLIVRNVDIVLPEVFLLFFKSLVPTDLDKTMFVFVFAFGDLLLSEGSDALYRGCWADQVLFCGIDQVFVGFEGFLPFPSEVSELVASGHEELGREHAFGFEIFVGDGYFGVDEVFYSVKHRVYLC